MASLGILAVVVGCKPKAEVPTQFAEAETEVNIYPDYKDVVVPPNIAPLNFIVRDSTATAYVVQFKGNGVNPESSIPVILASMHLGNWELAANCYSYYTNQSMCSIMRPLANKKIGNYFYTKRNGIAHETVSKEKGVKPLLTALRTGKTIAIVADQHASHNEGIELKFFGHPARTHMTPALLHLKTSVPIFTAVVVRKDDDFHFMITSGKLLRYTPTGDKEKDIRAITEAYSASYEKLIRRFPDQWLWAHRRWLDCGRHSTWSPDHFETVKRNQTAENDNSNA